MNRFTGLVLAALMTAPVAVRAQTSPYAGEETRDIKALSAADQQALREGQGMGFAKAAELNGYPGPRHVLDAAAQLTLSETQLNATRALFEQMRERAVALGERVLERERDLDRLFAAAQADAVSVRSLLAEIAALNADLRFTHLQAHLTQKALMSSHQVMLYQRVRGYSSDAHGHAAGH